jgi:hypothetical protein
VGILARKAKLKPRDVVPGIVLACTLGLSGKEDIEKVLNRVLDQIGKAGFDRNAEMEARAMAGRLLATTMAHKRVVRR